MNLGQLQRYDQEKIAASVNAIDERTLTLSEQLKRKLKYHNEQIEKINLTLSLLETNKDIEKLIYLLNEVH